MSSTSHAQTRSLSHKVAAQVFLNEKRPLTMVRQTPYTLLELCTALSKTSPLRWCQSFQHDEFPSQGPIEGQFSACFDSVGLQITATITGHLLLPCDHCLNDVAVPILIEATESVYVADNPYIQTKIERDWIDDVTMTCLNMTDQIPLNDWVYQWLVTETSGQRFSHEPDCPPP